MGAVGAVTISKYPHDTDILESLATAKGGLENFDATPESVVCRDRLVEGQFVVLE